MAEARYTRIEMVDIARRLEACGEAFYDEALARAGDRGLRRLLRMLRDEEQAHAKAFDRLLDDEEDAKGEWRQDEQYVSWMHSFAARQVFPDPEAARAMVREMKSDRELLDQAVAFEEQTVEFLERMRPWVQAESRPVIDELIGQEIEHARVLREQAAALLG